MPILDKSKRNLLNVFEAFSSVTGVSLIQVFMVFHNGVSKIEHLIFRDTGGRPSITAVFSTTALLKTVFQKAFQLGNAVYYML